MKKYLITGAMALMAGFYLTSCTHDDIGYDTPYDEKTQTFEKVFKELYGTIDPNHDWGFTPFAEAVDVNVPATSRALTRGHYANANEWAATWIVPDALTEAQKDKVRRWFQQHQNPEGVAFSHKDFFVQQVYKGGTNTTGSESPEKYTAANGGLITGSNQMDLLTCGSYGEGAQTADDEGNSLNQGHNYYDHINNFNNGTYSGGGTVNVLDNGQPINGGSSHPDQIMLMVDSKSDCFGYWNSAGSIGFNNRYVIIPGDEIQKWDNSKTGSDGSSADVSGMWFVGLDYDQRVESAYTNNWYTGPDGNQYRYLNSDMNQYCGEKILRDPEPTGAAAQKLLDDGYLPVDGSANKTWVKITSCADGYYSDWIVRVIPGTKRSGGGGEDPDEEETTTSKKYKARRHLMMARGRIFVEDLYKATREDLDYNDAVYDAIIWYDHDVSIEVDANNDEHMTNINSENDKYMVEIALLAAGGTIPLTIAGNTKNEHGFGDVHSAFGVGGTTIVNTVGEASNVFGSMVTGKDYAYHKFDYTTQIFAALEAKRAAGKEVKITLNDIPVDVMWSVEGINVGARLNNEDIKKYTINENGEVVLDTSDPEFNAEAKAPHMIQVPIGTPWAQERVNINQAHTQFKAWVGDKDEYDDTVWSNSTADLFYCYGDNPSPLAYGDPNTYPNGYSYLTDIVPDIEGIILWQGTSTSNRVEVTTSVESGIQIGDKIRVYGSGTGKICFWDINWGWIDGIDNVNLDGGYCELVLTESTYNKIYNSSSKTISFWTGYDSGNPTITHVTLVRKAN